MKTTIAGLEFDDVLGSNTDPYIALVFGAEGTGKTRFGLTGPDVVGCVPLEMKAYKTLDEVGVSLGKRVLKPKDPTKLLVPNRRVDAMTENDAQQFYKSHLKIVDNIIYAMLENKDVRTVMVDKWSTYCAWVRFATYGLVGKKVRKIGDQMYIDLGESNQKIMDVMNSFSQYGKTVILTCSEKAEYVNNKDTGNSLAEGMKYLGSHANLSLHLVENKFWKEGSGDSKKAWRFRLNVRQAQGASHLCGPEGNPLLEDEEINLANVVMNVEGDRFDAEVWA